MPQHPAYSAPLHPPASLRQLSVLLAVWTLLVAVSLALSISRIQQHAHDLMLEGARNVFRTIVAARAWNASSGGVYVPASEQNPPNPFLFSPSRDLHTDKLSLTQINPAYMTRQIAHQASLQGTLKIHMTSLRVLRPENSPDSWEKQSLARLEQGELEVGEVVERANEEKEFRFMAPLFVDKTCLGCHAHQGYAIGDVRGGISISQPWQDSATRNQIIHSSLLHALVFLLLAGGSLLAHRSLAKRWAQTEQAMSGLMQAEKMASMGRLVSGFSHELNTPLGVAISALSHHEHCLDDFGHLLQREEVPEQEIRALLTDMRESGQLAQSNLRRAANLVSGFKRSSTDIEREDIRHFKLREIVDEVLQTLSNVYKKTARIELDCPPELSMTSVPGLLDQIFTNLIVNSVTHAFGPEQSDGHIRIAIDSDGAGQILIGYADDGKGMSPAVQRRIFEPFFTTRQAQGGTGLGLYICYSLVTERLGGSIRCDSLPGAGTHFLIRLPQHTPTAPSGETP
ncbi:ATP-binding protein [Uliginosibacterium aquaticum]|uniref:histidine kinase n=1 Tax=Uliginosibacterium aquaticum TaxID=2731212 RepID=A0ABX2IH65_9RHOO|nr:ATP-binding protein [Uliginosibacterium aquaticum]NSL56118.1 DUF3365 domain-containing protein [Uliginosibacterium aquaticum]